MDEIAKGCGPHCGHWEHIQELERLRALITAWADATDNLRKYQWRDDDGDYASARQDAVRSLRKAVGR